MTVPIEKDLICIVCPNGCRLHGVLSEDGELTVTGNKCVRGLDFAGTELTNPVRSLTTTVRTAFDDYPWLPVRTDGEIPKAFLPEALDQLKAHIVTKRCRYGDVILAGIAGTDVNVIATASLTEEEVTP